MSALTHFAASNAVAALRLSGSNKLVARSWLSSWSNEQPPGWLQFGERCDWRLKPGIACFEVHRGISVNCITAGGYFRLALGVDLTGQNILALTPAADRENRMERAWTIGNGAIQTGGRTFRSLFGRNERADELYLPLYDERDADLPAFLMHSNWRPDGDEWVPGAVTTDLGPVSDPNTVFLE